ncbi:MAG: hypothetical protein K2F94_04415 [Muribaculaceae bacterium]|nr:hypothetical protein [Muribaculaceae bacterium]
MKKIIAISMVALAIGGIAVAVQKRDAPNQMESDLIMASIAAISRNEAAENAGPGKEVKCAGGLHKKICMCQPGYPGCTESDCY